jgi:hypothetical protein
MTEFQLLYTQGISMFISTHDEIQTMDEGQDAYDRHKVPGTGHFKELSGPVAPADKNGRLSKQRIAAV